MPVKDLPLPALYDPRFRFCLLACAPREESETPLREGKSILLLIEQAHRVQVFVDPNWRKVVQTDDHEFLEELIADFKQRAECDPANLFGQCRSLSVGPLVTQEEGPLQVDNSRLWDAVRRFVAL